MNSKIQIMGILNVTPDSFSDGGNFYKIDSAVKHAEQMLEAGVDIIDIGGESTRPGAQAVSTAQELDRVIPVLEKLKQSLAVRVSVDTSKAAVMKEAINHGADMINDVRALREEEAIEVCAKSDVDICLMHMQGQPRTMQASPVYEDVVEDIYSFLEHRINVCVESGIKKERLVVDPGFGFGKTLQHNLQLLKGLDQFCNLELPVLVGISRKSMIGTLLKDAPVTDRLYGSLAAHVVAAMNGASIIRTHDVKETYDAMQVVSGVLNNG